MHKTNHFTGSEMLVVMLFAMLEGRGHHDMRIGVTGRRLMQHLFTLGIVKIPPPKHIFVCLQVSVRFNGGLVIRDTVKLYLNET